MKARRHCSQCQAPRAAFACGGRCGRAVYCNQECADRHFVNVHRVECAMHMRDAWTSIVQNTKAKELLFHTQYMSGYCVALAPGEELPLETHPNATQFFVVVQGQGWSTIDGARDRIQTHSMFYVPPGVAHKVEAGPAGLRMLTLYGPAEHETLTSSLSVAAGACD